MDSNKVKLFHSLNQLKLATKNILCATCGYWLKEEIYQHSNGKNYCKACSSPEVKDRRRIKELEDALKELLFPCKYKDCDFLLRGNQVDDHQRKCLDAPFDCNLCGVKNMIYTEFEAHLKSQHVDKTIQMDKPVLKLTLNEPTKNEILIATLKQHIFLIHIKRTKNKLSVQVAKIQNVFYKSLLMSNFFTVYCKDNDDEQMFKKSFIGSSEIRLESNNEFNINVKINKPLNLEIFLCDFDKVLTFAECPICDYYLAVEVYQCENGHNVCIRCGKKIDTCAICRSINIKVISLKFLFPQTPMLCPNFDNGCLAIIKGDDVDAHLKSCFNATVQCVVCNEECLKCDILSHTKTKHTSWRNFQLLCCRIYNEFNTYIIFKNHIFAFKLKSTGIGSNKKICYNVQLLYNANIEEVHKFRYEINIHEKNTAEIAYALRGVCQSSSDLDTSLSIYFDACAKSFVTIDGIERMYYSYGIVEIM